MPFVKLRSSITPLPLTPLNSINLAAKESTISYIVYKEYCIAVSSWKDPTVINLSALVLPAGTVGKKLCGPATGRRMQHGRRGGREAAPSAPGHAPSPVCTQEGQGHIGADPKACWALSMTSLQTPPLSP